MRVVYKHNHDPLVDVKYGLHPVDPAVVATIRRLSLRPGVQMLAIRDAAFECGQERVEELGLPSSVGQWSREQDQRYFPSDRKITDIPQKIKGQALMSKVRTGLAASGGEGLAATVHAFCTPSNEPTPCLFRRITLHLGFTSHSNSNCTPETSA